MFNPLQQELDRAAKELGLRVVIGYAAHLSNGAAIQSQAQFPDLGGASGTIVFDSQDTCDAETRRELAALGFSLSTFYQPSSDEDFDLGSYAEMFKEWGWTGDEHRKPSWIACGQADQ